MDELTLSERLRQRGVSRRGFMKFCAATASMMALPPIMIPKVAAALEQARRPSVIWLSFQECTGCTESLTRSHAPTIEGLIFDHISLDYHHTLQAAAGDAAEHARDEAMKKNWGEYLLVVDGSIPLGENGNFSAIAGISNLEMLKEVAEGAAAIVSVGTCAAFGGLPMANPNPTGAVSVSDIIKDKPIVNVPGCPPIPTVDYRRSGTFPDLRPTARTGSSESPKGIFWPEYPRSLLSSSVLRARPVCRDLRRRGRAQGLVPVQAGLQGSDDLQRLCNRQVERGYQLADRVRARLYRLFGTQFLGCGWLLPGLVRASHERRRDHSDRGCRGYRHWCGGSRPEPQAQVGCGGQPRNHHHQRPE